MADVQDANTASEPSMEEILASIRKIIADEKDPEAAPTESPAEPTEGDDVLELTQMVQDDGSIMDLTQPAPVPVEEVAFTPPPPAPEPFFEPVPMPVFEAPPPPPPPPPEPLPLPDDHLMSAAASSAASSSLASLASTIQHERAAVFPSGLSMGNAGQTLEDVVKGMLRPMLKDWLDQNLPPIVDRIVQKEVERIARKVQE